jgi:hypothetical protein
MARMKVLRNFLIATAAAALLLAGWIAIRRNAPPLRLRQAANQVTIDVQTLGEYPTTVSRICLLDVNRSVVWEVAAQSRDVQIRGLVLKVGDNKSLLDADHGTYQVIAPKSANSFVLFRSTRYTIELWGGDSTFSRRSATFILGN